MRPCVENALRICERMAEVEGGDSVKNGLQRVRFALACVTGESEQTFCALEYLQRPLIGCAVFLSGRCISLGIWGKEGFQVAGMMKAWIVRSVRLRRD